MNIVEIVADGDKRKSWLIATDFLFRRQCYLRVCYWYFRIFSVCHYRMAVFALRSTDPPVFSIIILSHKQKDQRNWNLAFNTKSWEHEKLQRTVKRDRTFISTCACFKISVGGLLRKRENIWRELMKLLICYLGLAIAGDLLCKSMHENNSIRNDARLQLSGQESFSFWNHESKRKISFNDRHFSLRWQNSIQPFHLTASNQMKHSEIN